MFELYKVTIGTQFILCVKTATLSFQTTLSEFNEVNCITLLLIEEFEAESNICITAYLLPYPYLPKVTPSSLVQ
jgi:hypothetical protein